MHSKNKTSQKQVNLERDLSKFITEHSHKWLF